MTGGFDVVRGFVAGMSVQLFTNTPTLAAANNANLAGVDNTAVFARGTFNEAAGTFTFAANGADTAMTCDTNIIATAFETIIFVGFVQGATTAISALGGVGLITFG